MRLRYPSLAGFATLVAVGTAPAAFGFTQDQAEAGKSAYEAHCAACHGFRAEGGEAPQLSGIDVMGNFATGAGLYDFFSQTMPPQAPGLLSDEVYLSILARILVLNGAEPDGNALIADHDALASVSLAGLGHVATAPAEVAAADAVGMGTNVPQAFTWGVSLPMADGTMTEVAAAPAESAPSVPQAYTYGKELPQAN